MFKIVVPCDEHVFEGWRFFPWWSARWRVSLHGFGFVWSIFNREAYVNENVVSLKYEKFNRIKIECYLVKNLIIFFFGGGGLLSSFYSCCGCCCMLSLFFIVVVVIVVAFFVLMNMHIDILLSFCMQCTGHSAICRTCSHVKHAICQNNVRPHTW